MSTCALQKWQPKRTFLVYDLNKTRGETQFKLDHDVENKYVSNYNDGKHI